MIFPACFTYFRASGDRFRTKSNRIEFDCSIGSIIQLTAKSVDVPDFVRLPNPIERLVFD